MYAFVPRACQGAGNPADRNVHGRIQVVYTVYQKPVLGVIILEPAYAWPRRRWMGIQRETLCIVCVRVSTRKTPNPSTSLHIHKRGVLYTRSVWSVACYASLGRTNLCRGLRGPKDPQTLLWPSMMTRAGALRQETITSVRTRLRRVRSSVFSR